MRRIPLWDKAGKVRNWAIVDDEDYAIINSFRWHAKDGKYTVYARSKAFYMHRVILKAPPGNLVVDHINGNGLDNRKKNLRLCTIGENNNNRHSKNKNNSSGFRGVWWSKHDNAWRATAKRIHLGSFKTKADAAKAVKAFWKAYAHLNSKKSQ